MLTIELDTTEEKFIQHACDTNAQLARASRQDRAGLPAGQNIEALRRELAWLRHKLPDELKQKIKDAIEAGTGENDKPP